MPSIRAPAARPSLDTGPLADLIRLQDGLVVRRQILEQGGDDTDIERWIRRRDLTARRPGLYTRHAGPLSRRQREWLAVLACWPAALCLDSALPSEAAADRPRASGGRPGYGAGVIQVAVARERGSVHPPDGVRLHRVGWLGEQVDWHRSPPRQRLEEAAIDVAARAERVADRFAVLASVCGERLTTPDRLRAALDHRPRIRDRRLLDELIDDVASGACSVLERDYLLLERRHGLPTADRQRRDRLPAGVVYRDAPYPAYGLVVELDGRAHHDPSWAGDRDAEPDLDTRVGADVLTVRLTGRQVWERGCVTISKIAILLERRGWDGPFLRCPDCGG